MDVAAAAAAAAEEEENIRGWGIVVERRKNRVSVSHGKSFSAETQIALSNHSVGAMHSLEKEVRSIPKDQSKKAGRLAAQMVGEADLGIGRGWGVFGAWVGLP
jgi:hypothetical protein